jgi:Nucleotide modification associated domain 5
MASIKLTRALKDAIRTEIKSDTYKKRYEANTAREEEWRTRTLLRFYPQTLRDTIRKLEPTWFDTACSMHLNIIGGDYLNLYFDTMPIPYYLNRTQQLEARDPLAEEYTLIKDDRKDIIDEESRADREINAILDSVSSDKQLKAIWPEVSSVIDKCIGLKVSNKTGLPVVLTDHLTTKFGLPREEAA